MIFEKKKRVRCEGRRRAPSLQGHSGNHTALALYPHCCASLLKLPLPTKVLNFMNLFLVPERHDLRDSAFSLCSECQSLKFKVYLHVCLWFKFTQAYHKRNTSASLSEQVPEINQIWSMNCGVDRKRVLHVSSEHFLDCLKLFAIREDCSKGWALDTAINLFRFRFSTN